VSVGGPRTPILAPDLLPPITSFIETALSPDASEIRDVGVRWGSGAEFRSIACSGDASAFDVCALPTFPDGTRSVLEDVDPFAVVVPDTCSAFGYAYNDYQARALMKHKAWESFVIAQQFWSGGVIPSSFHLAAGGAVTDISPSGVALEPHEALGLLESELGECLRGARGMIYVTPRIFGELFLAAGLYRPNGGRLVLTHMGTIVAADSGFPGTDPNGNPESPTVEWMYGTAPAKIYRSNPIVYPTEADYRSNPKAWQAVARDRNDVTFRAESLAAVAVDPCCLLGIRVAVGPATEEGGAIGSSLVDHSGTITSGGTQQTLMAANPTRRYLLIENLSSGDLWFNFTTNAIVGQPSLQLPAGASYDMSGDFVSTERVSIIGATTGQAFATREG
jgi:hypothetical protein